MESLKDIVQHPLAGLIGLLGTILGLILAYVFYRLGKKEKKPYWTVTGSNLIRGFSTALPRLQVKYGPTEVENLTITKLVFWNAGRETIKGTDIAEADKLRIVEVKPDVHLLDIKVAYANSGPSNVSVPVGVGVDKKDEVQTFLTFDFLDRDQGAIIQVIHTGTSINDVGLKGTIKGAGVPKYVTSELTLVGVLLGNLLPLIATIITLLLGFVIMNYFQLGNVATLIISVSLVLATMFGTMFLIPSLLSRVPKQFRS